MTRAALLVRIAQLRRRAGETLAALDTIPAAELAEALGLRAVVCHGDGAGCMDARGHRPHATIRRSDIVTRDDQ